MAIWNPINKTVNTYNLGANLKLIIDFHPRMLELRSSPSSWMRRDCDVYSARVLKQVLVLLGS